MVPEPTDEELLAQLGLQLEQQMADLTANDELPAGIMQQWAEEEVWRDVQQWHPKQLLPDEDSEEEEEGGDGAAEAVSFQDIKHSMLGPCELFCLLNSDFVIAACNMQGCQRLCHALNHLCWTCMAWHHVMLQRWSADDIKKTASSLFRKRQSCIASLQQNCTL